MTGANKILNSIGFVFQNRMRPDGLNYYCYVPDFEQIGENIINVSQLRRSPIEVRRFATISDNFLIFNRVLLTDSGEVIFRPATNDGPIRVSNTTFAGNRVEWFEKSGMGQYVFGILEEVLRKVIKAPCANQCADITDEEAHHDAAADWSNWNHDASSEQSAEERPEMVTVPITDLSSPRNNRTISQDLSYDDVMAYSLMNNWVSVSNNLLNTTLDTMNRDHTIRAANQTLSTDQIRGEAENIIRDNALNRVHTERLVREIHDRLDTMFSRHMPQSVSDAIRVIATVAPRAEEDPSNTSFVLDSLGPLEHGHSDGETTQRVSTSPSSDPQPPHVNEDGSIQAIPY